MEHRTSALKAKWREGFGQFLQKMLLLVSWLGPERAQSKIPWRKAGPQKGAHPRAPPTHVGCSRGTDIFSANPGLRGTLWGAFCRK